MIELGDTIETYEVAVVALVPVKRLVRVKATSEGHAREIAKQTVREEIQRGENHEWSLPQCSRDEVPSDQHLLGGLHMIHHEAIQDQLYSGLNPTKVVE